MPKSQKHTQPATTKPKPIPKSLQGLYPDVAQALLPLNVQRRKFVMAYCGAAEGSQVLAAQMAGVRGTYATQSTRASIWMREPEVRFAVATMQERYAMNAMEVVARVGFMARANPRPFFEVQDGKLQLRGDISKDDWERFSPWVKELEMNKDGKVIRMQMVDSLRALDLESKINKLHTDSPILILSRQVRNKTDAELLEELHQLTDDDEDMLRLPAGDPVAVVDP